MTVCLCAIALLMAGIVGCGRDDQCGRINISGRVTFREAAVPKGRIDFISPGSSDKSESMGHAIIEHGEFDTARAGRGVAAGEYIVRLRGFDGNASPVDELLYGRPLFTYESRIDVTSDQNHFEFNVPHQNSSRGR